MNKKYNILDFYVHQGHQREFFKLDHNFYLTNHDGKLPNWNTAHRKLNPNVQLIDLKKNNIKFDIVMVRTPINPNLYLDLLRTGSRGIGVIQTFDPVNLHNSVKHIVWNSKIAMNNHVGFFKGKKEYHIVHGYDPEEFIDLKLSRNNEILTVANVFKKRSKIMGYNIWDAANRKLGGISLVGHGNTDIPGSIKEAKSFDELIKLYNTYGIFFNPTIKSAMPRSRAEAAMCGMPIVSTGFCDFSFYFRNKKDAFISNNTEELIRYLKQLKDNKNMRVEYGSAAREAAIKHFHIKEYLSKWEDVIKNTME